MATLNGGLESDGLFKQARAFFKEAETLISKAQVDFNKAATKRDEADKLASLANPTAAQLKKVVTLRDQAAALTSNGKAKIKEAGVLTTKAEGIQRQAVKLAGQGK